jgi:hypothetical protein
MSAKKKGMEFPSKSNRIATNGDNLKRALSWVLDDGIFAGLRFHGNVSWTPVALVRLAIFWVWSTETSLVAAADEAMGTVTGLFGTVAVRSYQALMGALKTYSVALLPPLWSRLHALMRECDTKTWRVGLWLALAVDGSRLNVPRTLANEQQLCKQRSKRRKKRNKRRGRHANRKRGVRVRQKSHYNPQPVGPQMWLTLLWHIGQRMPWCWEVGPSYASEREHMLKMLAQHKFPENTLFCADAGFVGYDFWCAIHDAGKHFLIRVGGNVRLLKKLGCCRERAGIVYSWPDDVMKKRQAPLVLRLLHLRTFRGDVYLVTNVLSEADLTLAQGAEIYRRRWGVELQFRAFKQTYQRSKLRSRTPACAEAELHWALVGLWVVQLLAFKEQAAMAEPAEQTSIASVLRIVRTIIKDESKVPVQGKSLQKQLANALTDNYERHSKKKSRNYPRRKEEPSAGAPVIRLATTTHKKQLQEIQGLAQAA